MCYSCLVVVEILWISVGDIYVTGLYVLRLDFTVTFIVFARTGVTQNTNKFIVSQFWRPEVQRDSGQNWLLLRTVRENLFPAYLWAAGDVLAISDILNCKFTPLLIVLIVSWCPSRVGVCVVSVSVCNSSVSSGWQSCWTEARPQDLVSTWCLWERPRVQMRSQPEVVRPGPSTCLIWRHSSIRNGY